MKIRSVKFLKSSTTIEDFNGLPQIALVGRSNVGKSSLINYLTNTKIAKKSSSPGRTRLLNYFEINGGEFLLVDLPGYGFSLAGKDTSNNWGDMITKYLMDNKNISNLLFLVDIRIEPTKDDMQMLKFMNFYNIPFTVVATKSDKLSKVQASLKRQEIATKLKVGVENVYLVSSEKRIGGEDLLDRIGQFVK